MFVKRLRAILIDRALYKYCIIIIIMVGVMTEGDYNNLCEAGPGPRRVMRA